MIKQLGKISAVLFVGAFCFTVALTLTASPTYAIPCSGFNCCEVWDGET